MCTNAVNETIKDYRHATIINSRDVKMETLLRGLVFVKKKISYSNSKETDILVNDVKDCRHLNLFHVGLIWIGIVLD